jgi:hypothetical protein
LAVSVLVTRKHVRAAAAGSNVKLTTGLNSTSAVKFRGLIEIIVGAAIPVLTI